MANVGCCGMDCDACEARLATKRRDNSALARIAAEQEGRGCSSFVLPSSVRCTGCLTAGDKSRSCAECAIRECATAQHIPNCGVCPDFPCELGAAVWEAIPEYKHNLEVLRSR